MDADADKPHEPPQAAPALPGVATSAERSAQELLHELQVHQHQLEMQNESLRLAQSALQDSRDRYLNLYEFAPVGYLTLTAEGLISGINLTGIKLFAAQRHKLLQQRFAAWVLPDDLARWYEFFLRLKQPYGQDNIELALCCADGRVFQALLEGVQQASVTDGVALLIAVTDISQRQHDQAQLELAASVFTHAREGIMITQPNGSIIDVNQAFCRITGYSRAEVLGKTPHILSSGRHDRQFFVSMFHALKVQGYWYGEIWNRRKNGEVFAEMQAISAVADGAGNVLHYVALFSDITELKEHELQLEHIAHFDALTNLPNRVLLADRLQQAMVQALRREERVAVAYLDLDGFKAINDRHGHYVGDQLLIMLAARMKESLREGDTLGRLGGDEFVAILLNLEDLDASASMLNRLLKAASLPVHIGELRLKVSASIGVTFYPQPDIDAEQLLRQADQAMYQAKLAGKNRYCVFDAEQDNVLRGHHESLERVRLALLNNEFVLYYQPKVNMRSGAVIGVEALIRWQCPERGLLAPALFLPVIEEHPLAIDVGEWVIHSALRQLEVWRAAGLTFPVSVNIGARQLQQLNFVQRLREILTQYPTLQCSDLELEILETSALEDLARVSQVIETCQEMGIRFALDDFGTGYSSLTYLKRLPVAVLKIDQTFVRDMLDDPSDLSILDGILSLAQAFDRQAIAEGVETLAHGAMLLQMGCELGQGYGIARPLHGDRIPEWIATWRVDATWRNLPLVSRADLPRLYAYVEHRAWIKALASHLKGERNSPPPLDQYQCHFGKWLQAEGLDQYLIQARLPAIEQLHGQMHGLAAQLVELQCSDGTARALERLDELHGLNELLLEQLRLLNRESSAAG